MDRMANCLRVLGSSESTPQSFQDVWLKVCRQSFAGMIKDKLSRTAEELKKEVNSLRISFNLQPHGGLSDVEGAVVSFRVADRTYHTAIGAGLHVKLRQ